MPITVRLPRCLSRYFPLNQRLLPLLLNQLLLEMPLIKSVSIAALHFVLLDFFFFFICLFFFFFFSSSSFFSFFSFFSS
jgi:hypothetical protein